MEFIKNWLVPEIPLASSGSTGKRSGSAGALHIRHKGANNRAEKSHQPTRNWEHRMKGFKSMAHVKRFLSLFNSIYDLYSMGRHHLKANNYRILLAFRFNEWRAVTQVAPRAAGGC